MQTVNQGDSPENKDPKRTLLRGLALARRAGQVVLLKHGEVTFAAQLAESAGDLARLLLSLPDMAEPAAVALARLGGKFQLVLEMGTGIYASPGASQVTVGRGPTRFRIAVVGSDHECCVLRLNVPGIEEPIVMGVIPGRNHARFVIDAKPAVKIHRAEMFSKNGALA